MSTKIQIILSEENSKSLKQLQKIFLPLCLNLESYETKELYKKMEKTIKNDRPVFISGEIGTEKESIAYHVFSSLNQNNQSLTLLDCLDQTKEAIEKQLFSNKSNSGILFINNIDHLSLVTLEKLVQAFQEKQFQARLIVASSKQITEISKDKNFAKQLFSLFKDNVLEVPPLRKRKEDVPILIYYFLRSDTSFSKMEGIDEDALRVLLQYDFPGNMNELFNILERSATLSKNTSILLHDIPQDIRNKMYGLDAQKMSLDDFIANEEKTFIMRALKECKGNKTKAAESLGVSRRNLYRKLTQYDL